MQALVESLFDIFYLATVIILAFKMVKGAKGSKQFYLLGTMALVLGFGDAFHLVPRVLALNTNGLDAYARSLGMGKFITSITMSIFYLLLYYVWRERYNIKEAKGLTGIVWILLAIRIGLCLMPQNKWLSPDAPLAWGIYRNIPFIILGLIITIIFYKSSRKEKDINFKNLWLTIVLSFGFYIPVVLLADSIPLVGMLMIPKTCAYIWTVLIAYKAMKKEVI